jgi:DNA-binding transcriptional regulator GbsR (MarR family)
MVAEAVGRLMTFWGFKRNMGRIWGTLYLSDRPLTARELKEGLGISVGSVGMTLAELERWEVVHRATSSRERARTFEAETDLWKMITRVFRDRERLEIGEARKVFLEALDRAREGADGPAPDRSNVEEQRIEALLDLTRLGITLLDALVATGRVDASPLARSLMRD